MSEPTLKPCPRCGGAAGYDRSSHLHDAGWAVRCTVCGMSGMGWDAGPNDAASWWNERPAESIRAEDAAYDRGHADGLAAGRKLNAEQAGAAYSIGAERDYDSGLLNDWGGGNVQWWQDYIRSEVERCNGYWRSILAADFDRAAEHLAEPTRDAAEPEPKMTPASAPSWPPDALERVLEVKARLDAAERHQPEPTHNAAEPPPHQCPYEGCMWTSPTATWADEPKCGDYGWLCDRCKEDRADARAGVGNRLLAVEEYAAAIDARASSVEVDVEILRDNVAGNAMIDKHLLRRLVRRIEELESTVRGVAELFARIEALEARLPGPQTRTQDLGTHHMGSESSQACPECGTLLRITWESDKLWCPRCRVVRPKVDEPTQHGEARTCGNCGHCEDVTCEGQLDRFVCTVSPLPMWVTFSDRDVDDLSRNACSCAAWTPKEAKA